MTRRKSVCLKWTLVILVVVFCPSVHLRPQESTTVATASSAIEKSTDVPIRYTFRHSFSLNNFKAVPLVISSKVRDISNHGNVTFSDMLFNKEALYQINNNMRNTNRTNRRISRDKYESRKRHRSSPIKNKIEDTTLANERRHPAIRKVLTKWKDKTKYDDLDFPHEVTTSMESKPGSNDNILPNDDANTENSNEKSSKRFTRPPEGIYYNVYSPQSHYAEVGQTYLPHVDNIRPQRPYIYESNPNPAPIITNVGYPKPWVIYDRKTTTQRPVHPIRPTNYEYHNSVNSYSGSNYETVTFAPSNSYTERIVIRPQEYSPSAEDCPTIFLTLNSTFQGQAKEACPDLNIAVNTNVINKNVVVESEEDEDGEGIFPESFGLGFGDDSSNDEGTTNDYFGSDENQEQEDSASVEDTELASYHAAHSVVQSESNEAGSYGAAASPISAIIKPQRPNNSDDDLFGFSSLVEYFRPAFHALGYLASINPFSIGILPLLIAPLGFLFAGSGFAALFGPLFLTEAREAPKVIHVYRPQWHWDDTAKTWYLHSFPNNREYVKDGERVSKELKPKHSSKPTLLDRIKQWMLNMTNKLKEAQNRKFNFVGGRRKNRKRKRETENI